jgi:hypothetical protein
MKQIFTILTAGLLGSCASLPIRPVYISNLVCFHEYWEFREAQQLKEFEGLQYDRILVRRFGRPTLKAYCFIKKKKYDNQTV